MGHPALNAAVIVLLPVFTVMVSAEMCPNAQVSGLLCREVCSLSNFMENVVRQINRCLNDTTTWTVSKANPVIILTPNNNKNEEGNRKTFRWRQGPPGAGMIRNVCTIRCTPRRPDTAKSQVKSVKQIPEHQLKPIQANVNPVSTGISRIAVDSEQVERERDIEGPTQQGRTQAGETVPLVQVEQQEKDTVLRGAVHSGAEMEGVCPGIKALECLAVMKVEKSNQGPSNVEKLNDPQYSDNSFKIKISGNDGRNVELTNHLLEHLKGLGASYCDKMNPGQKPRVVHVENTSTNDVSKYVIVEEVGDIMIGCPYPRPSITPVPPNGVAPINGRPSGTRGSAALGSPDVDKSVPLALNCCRRPFEHLELLSQIRPEPLVRNFPTHFKHQNNGFEGTGRPEPSQHNYQIVTDLPKYTTERRRGRTNTDHTDLYNVGCATTRFPHERYNWCAEETLPEIEIREETQSHGNENIFIPDEVYNSNNGPNSYWREGPNSHFTPTDIPKSLETPYNDMHKKYCDRETIYNQLLMNAGGNNNRQQPSISRRKQLGNTVQLFNQEPTQGPTRARLQPRRMPEYLRSTHKYNTAERCNSRCQRVFQQGRQYQGETRPTWYNGYNQNVMNGAGKVFEQQQGRGHPTWGPKVAPKCQFPRGMTGGRYCEPYDQRGYPRPIGYHSMREPVQPVVLPPTGYTLPPAPSQQMRMVPLIQNLRGYNKLTPIPIIV